MIDIIIFLMQLNADCHCSYKIQYCQQDVCEYNATIGEYIKINMFPTFTVNESVSGFSLIHGTQKMTICMTQAI